MAPKLDSNWIERAMRDRESGESTVITVQTSDPTRVNQLLATLATKYSTSFYLFQPWTGLEQWQPSKKRLIPVTSAIAGNAYDPTASNRIVALDASLRHMDALFMNTESRPTALVLKDVDNLPTEDTSRNTDLINALRHWAANTTLLAMKHVVFLITSSPTKAIDDSTFARTILARPDVSADTERLALVEDFVEQTSLPRNSNSEQLQASSLRGLNLHQSEVVLRKVYSQRKSLPLDEINHLKAEHIKRSDVLEIEEPTVSFKDIGGYEPVKRMVKENFVAVMQDVQRTKDAALDLPRGLLLFGPPGTGKTLFAKSLARETNLPFVNLKSENLFNMYLGVSGQRLRDAIRMAESVAPCIVFIDEIDRFGKRREASDGASEESSRVFSQMLEWLGSPDRKSIILGTTNVPENLDKAFTRPGRLSVCIPFLYPDTEARKQILKIHLGLAGCTANDPRRPVMDEASIDEIIPQIASKTEYFAGCDLEDLVIRGKQLFRSDSSVPRMTGAHLLAALADYTLDISDRQNVEKQYAGAGAKYAGSIRLLHTLEQKTP
jgi:AAA+ superfamily predicted ATPase